LIRSCLDDTQKTILRTYDWDGKLVQFLLCSNHARNQKFSGHISETKINCEVIQN